MATMAPHFPMRPCLHCSTLLMYVTLISYFFDEDKITCKRKHHTQHYKLKYKYDLQDELVQNK
jgi:hypothetical protein